MTGSGTAWWAALDDDPLLRPLLARQVAAWQAIPGWMAAPWADGQRVARGDRALLVGHGVGDEVRLGEGRVVALAELCAALAPASLVVLSACAAGQTLGPALARAGVGAVIGPTAPVHARDAAVFLEGLCAALGRGAAPDEAVCAGQRALVAAGRSAAAAMWAVTAGPTGSSRRS